MRLLSEKSERANTRMVKAVGRLPVWSVAFLQVLWMEDALAISENRAIVVNSLEALPAEACAGQTQIKTCAKLRGKLNVTAGTGTPSLYSIDELAFIKNSLPIGGVNPSNFTGIGVPSLGASPQNSSSLACYVMDANPGAPGWLNYSCEMSNLACNRLYSYHFAGGETTAGFDEYSNSNTTETSKYFYSTPCQPTAGVNGAIGATTASASVTISKGALPQTIGVELSTDQVTWTPGTIVANTTVPVSNNGAAGVTAEFTGLAVNTRYYYRFTSTTNDNAVNGTVTETGAIGSFDTVQTYTVMSSVGAGGSLSPSGPQTVAQGNTLVLTATPQPGYAVGTWGGTCGGVASGAGNVTYTTAGVSANCTVTASFVPVTTYTAPASGGGGNVTTALSGGGALCGLQTVAYQNAASVGAPPPSGVTFPHGVVNFTTTSTCEAAGQITITKTYPSAVPAGAKFWKYGPATAGAASSWYVHPAIISGNTVTYTVTDNGQGDSNGTLGLIVDPAGLGVGGDPAVAGVPTLSQWGMMLVAFLMAAAGFSQLRRRAH